MYLKIKSINSLLGATCRFHAFSRDKWGEEFEDKSYVYKLMALENFFERNTLITCLKYIVKDNSR